MLNPEEISYTEIDEGKEKIMENAIESYIAEYKEDGAEIGKGRTAKVLTLEEDRAICMKAVFNKEISLNDSYKEMDFLDELSKKGYPVPKPLSVFKTGGEDYFFMETVASEKSPDGLSLADLVDKNQIDKLPVNFDFKVFFEELDKIVDSMNKNEKIYHRDLHLGNIMINSEGLPSIIDFGDAERVFGGEDPFRKIDGAGRLKIIHKDSDKVKKAYREVGSYLKLHNWFKK